MYARYSLPRIIKTFTAGHPGVLNLVLRKHGYLSGYARDFVSTFAPHVSPELIARAMEGADIDKARLAQRAPVARFA